MAKSNKNKLDASLGHKPTKITQITKDYRRDYILHQAKTDENKAWYLELCKANLIDKKSKEKGEYKDIDVAPVRKAFVDRFFPELKKSKSKTTYFEELEELFK